VVVDGGRFDWANGNFPDFTEPDESYGGVRYADLGPVAFATRLRVQLLRDIGAALSPHNAFAFLQGLETLHVRIERHNENDLQVDQFQEKRPQIERVNLHRPKNYKSHA